MAIGLVLAAGASIAMAAVAEWVLVLGPTAASPGALVVCVVVAGLVMTSGHLLARRPGPSRAPERAVIRGVVASIAVLMLVGVPSLGFLVLMMLYGFVDALAAPVALGLVAGTIAVGAVGLRHRPASVSSNAGTPPGASPPVTMATRSARFVASSLVTVGVMVLSLWLLAGGLITADDDVVVAHRAGGCTAIVRQTQFLFTGEAVLYVASPGDVVAARRATYPLNDSFPFRNGGFVLDADALDVRIAFDSGYGPVDEVMSCR